MGGRVCVCVGGGTIDSPALLLFHPSTPPPRDSAKGLHRCCCRCLWPAVLAGVEESAAGGAQSLSSCLGSVATSGRRRASTARWSGSLLLGDFLLLLLPFLYLSSTNKPQKIRVDSGSMSFQQFIWV